jgi:hypothetical protein
MGSKTFVNRTHFEASPDRQIVVLANSPLIRTEHASAHPRLEASVGMDGMNPPSENEWGALISAPIPPASPSIPVAFTGNVRVTAALCRKCSNRRSHCDGWCFIHPSARGLGLDCRKKGPLKLVPRRSRSAHHLRQRAGSCLLSMNGWRTRPHLNGSTAP